MTEFDELDPALAALGSLDGAERVAARERASADPAYARAVEDWEAALAPLAGRARPVKPSADLFGRIEKTLDRKQALVALSRTIREGEGRWIEVSPGMKVRLLSREKEKNRQTVLVDLAPGSIYLAHAHPEDEELLMLSGDLSTEDEELVAGDYHFSRKGTRHPDAMTRRGCRCIVVSAIA
jgi:anti-sigma factor ChrR (cupin superfamily)